MTVSSEEEKKSLRDDTERFFNKIGQHLLGICLAMTKGEERATFVLSAFLISINDEWFIVTAGHSIDDVAKYRAAGYEITSCTLLDAVTPSRSRLPFDWDDAEPESLWKVPDIAWDYGVLRVSRELRRLLKSNSKEAIRESGWVVTCPADFYTLVGFPAEGVRASDEAIEFALSSIGVREVERDEPFQPPDLPMFYGQIVMKGGHPNVVGMSGGPIFGWRSGDNPGELHYWLHAVQSGQNKSDRRIMGPRTEVLGNLIARALLDAGGIGEMRNAETPIPEYWNVSASGPAH